MTDHDSETTTTATREIVNAHMQNGNLIVHGRRFPMVGTDDPCPECGERHAIEHDNNPAGWQLLTCLNCTNLFAEPA